MLTNPFQACFFQYHQETLAVFINMTMDNIR